MLSNSYARSKSLEMQALTLAIIIHAVLLFGYGVIFGAPMVFAKTKTLKIQLGGGGSIELGDEEIANYQDMIGPRKVEMQGPVMEIQKGDGKEQKPEEAKSAKTTVRQSATAGNIKSAGGKGIKNAPPGPGVPYGNTVGEGQVAAQDYLELLQYTVQENSMVPANIKNLRGTAVIRITFSRGGKVLAYAIRKRTGKRILDDAVVLLGEKLKKTGFPPAPANFDQADNIFKYDFLVRYPPHQK